MKKVLVFSLFFVLGGGLLFSGASRQQDARASGDSSQATIRVVWWGNDIRHKSTLESIAVFEKTYPEIKVMPEYMGSDSYWDKLAVQVAGGTAPDVIQFGSNYSEYVAKDVLLELEKYKGNLFDVSCFDQEAITNGTSNGHFYGISLGTNMLCLVYNKSMMEQLDLPLPAQAMTWDQLRQYCLSIAPKLPAGVWPMSDNGFNPRYFNYFLRQNNAFLYRNNTTALTPALGAQWLALWEGYRREKLIPDAETSSAYEETNVDNSAFVARKTAILLLYSNQVVSYQNAMKDEIEIIQLPDSQKNQNWLNSSQFMCVYKRSAYPDEAVKFINFFVNDIEVGKILGNERGISSSTIVRDVISSNVSPIEKKIFDYYALATQHIASTDPLPPKDQEFTNTFKLIYQQVAFGQSSVGQGAQEAYDLILRIMK
jgi:multiple sugar transport system substrate-binding protein